MIGTIDIINPRRACAARVTVVGSVCVCVCLLSHISPMERLFVLKTLSRTKRATKVKIFVGFSLKPLRCRDPALPPLCGRAYSRPFFLRKARMRIIVFTTWRPFLPVWWCREDGCEFRELPLVMPPSKVHNVMLLYR